MISNQNLVSLQFQTTEDFEKNLQHLISLIQNTPQNSFIVAPELCLSGFCYGKFDKAIITSKKAIKILTKLSKDKTITLTLLTKKDNNYYNTLYTFHKNTIIHTQSKVKLFELGSEQHHFKKGSMKDIKIINIENIKVGFLICFEIRFIELWEILKGADIIVIPAMWGKPRKSQFITILKAMAIINQCFVIASNSSNSDMAGGSCIISPFGKRYKNRSNEILSKNINLFEIKKMRRYLNIGL